MTRFLEENETIILFAQGLVFFSLGFAVWLQRRRATRLTLTQSLIYLAAFAFVEALAVWGYVFVPLQEGYVRASAIDVLLVLRTLLQTGAFVFLFRFGLRLLIGSRSRRNLATGAVVGVWVAILGVGAAVAVGKGWDVGQWERTVEALSRHVLLIPAAALSAVGLWRQRAELAEAGLPGIRPYAAATAGALLAYLLVGGVLVDHVFWDPGAAGTDGERFDAFGIQIALVRGAVGLALVILAVKLLEIFDFEAKQQLENVDRARAVAEERARFGRDLHDGTIQSLYAAGLHLESVAITSADEATTTQVRQVVDGLNETISGIREYISGLREPEADAQLIAVGLGELARRFAGTTGLDVRFHVRGVPDAGIVPDDAAQHLEHVLREALSNAARHGAARCVDVDLVFTPDELDLVIDDDGVGIDDPPQRVGEGLRNIRERARRLGGRAVIERIADHGTRVSLAIPLDNEAPDESETQPQEVLR